MNGLGFIGAIAAIVRMVLFCIIIRIKLNECITICIIYIMSVCLAVISLLLYIRECLYFTGFFP